MTREDSFAITDDSEEFVYIHLSCCSLLMFCVLRFAVSFLHLLFLVY